MHIFSDFKDEKVCKLVEFDVNSPEKQKIKKKNDKGCK